jgi:hypothetical protein
MNNVSEALEKRAWKKKSKKASHTQKPSSVSNADNVKSMEQAPNHDKHLWL